MMRFVGIVFSSIGVGCAVTLGTNMNGWLGFAAGLAVYAICLAVTDP